MSAGVTVPLFGLISAEAAMRAGERVISELWVNINPKKRNIKLGKLLRKCETLRIPVTYMEREAMTEACGDAGHGGVVLWAGERPFRRLDSLFTGERGPVFLIEGIEDPYNFGTLTRSLYAAGASGLLLPPRNWMTAAGVVARASAGTSELLPMAVFESPAQLASVLPDSYRLVSAGEDKRAVCLYDADLTGNILVCVGGEKRGLSAELTKLSSQTIRIPYARTFNLSLPAHTAAAVIAFEAQRQARERGEAGNGLRRPLF